MANSEILRERLSSDALFPIAVGFILIGTVATPILLAYNAGQEEAREKTFGLRFEGEDLCGARGSIHLPKLRKQLNPVTVIVNGKTFEVDPTKGILSGQFSLDKGVPFLPVDVDGKGKLDRIYVNYEDGGVVNYEIECVNEPTPNPEKPATPTSLSSQHDRLIAYRGGFNGTKPAGRERRGGTIFNRRRG